ncbi:MAG: acetyltransferase [Syntrophomonadaceae bacterium]
MNISLESNNEPVIIVGGGGHAVVLLDVLLRQNRKIIGVTEADPERAGKDLMGVRIIGADDAISVFLPDGVCLVNALGFVNMPNRRKQIYIHFKKLGYHFAPVVSGQAFIGAEVSLGEGCQLMPGSMVQTGSRIGNNVLINTGAIVDHQCIIDDHVHIAPGAVLSGCVSVGEGTLIGTGARIIQGIKIGAGCIIGAGSVVVKDIGDSSTAVGIPAKAVKNLEK